MVNEAQPRSASSCVTIVISPWHFSATRSSLESIFAFTEEPYELVYVDGNSPPQIESYLQTRARERGFSLLRCDRYLTSSEARNIGMQHVSTEYVVFVDNCTIVSPGWLSSLIQCAQETGAWAVGPLYCQGAGADPTVYSAAPALQIIEENGRRRLHETAPHAVKRLADVRQTLQRGPCGYVKSFCMLTRKSVVELLGGFDERYYAFQEHRDFCLSIAAAGGSLVCEPAAVVFLETAGIALTDLPMLALRYSDAWLRPSVAHFAAKWNLPENDHIVQGVVRYRDNERRRMFQPLLSAGARALGWRGRRMAEIIIDAFFDGIFEPTFVRKLECVRLAARRPSLRSAIAPVEHNA
jgi:hypothetical protein